MRSKLLVASGLCLMLCGPAFAQDTTTSNPKVDANTTAGSTTGQQEQASAQDQGQNQNETPMQVREDMKQDLQKAGFTNVQVMPESYMIRAHDKQGRPVMMVVNPDSVLAITTLKTAQNDTANPPKAKTGTDTTTQ